MCAFISRAKRQSSAIRRGAEKASAQGSRLAKFAGAGEFSTASVRSPFLALGGIVVHAPLSLWAAAGRLIVPISGGVGCSGEAGKAVASLPAERPKPALPSAHHRSAAAHHARTPSAFSLSFPIPKIAPNPFLSFPHSIIAPQLPDCLMTLTAVYWSAENLRTVLQRSVSRLHLVSGHSRPLQRVRKLH